MFANRTKSGKKLKAFAVGVAFAFLLWLQSSPATPSQAALNAHPVVVVADGGGNVPPPGSG